LAARCPVSVAVFPLLTISAMRLGTLSDEIHTAANRATRAARMSKAASPFRYFNSSPEVIRLVGMMYVKYPLRRRRNGRLQGRACVGAEEP